MDRLRQVGILTAGWVFLVLGVLGLFLPFLQGILFIMIGLAILSSRSKTIQRVLRKLERRYPRYHDRIADWREKIRGWISKR